MTQRTNGQAVALVASVVLLYTLVNMALVMLFGCMHCPPGGNLVYFPWASGSPSGGYACTYNLHIKATYLPAPGGNWTDGEHNVVQLASVAMGPSNACALLPNWTWDVARIAAIATFVVLFLRGGT